MTENHWRKIWQSKGNDLPASQTVALEELIRADGFDSGAGDHCIESWSLFARQVYDKLKLGPDDRVLEVGCGGGAFLYLAREFCHSITGIDYSDSLIALARRAMPNGHFFQAEAANLPFDDNTFDLVLSHSVFQYFPSEDYARRSLAEMQRVLDNKNSRLAILDINDVAREDIFYSVRQARLNRENYQAKYSGLPHRFYEKQWFQETLVDAGFNVEIADQAIAGYGNSAFRFNVFAERLS